MPRAPKAKQAANYDDLPDLSADLSNVSSSSIRARPTFEQLNSTLVSRGYLRTQLDVSGMKADALEELADALHAMIAQREEDLEVRTTLAAQSRTLNASLERTKRFLKEQEEKSADLERKAEAVKAKLGNFNSQLEAEQASHRSTKDALSRTKRDLQVVKASALQYRAANDRSVAKIRARIGEVTTSAIRSVIPDFKIVASAFDEPAASFSAAQTSSSRSGTSPTIPASRKRTLAADTNPRATTRRKS